MNIDKDTLIFGSFSKKAGNVGCKYFNSIFKEYNINAIYKSFSINNIENAINAAKCLNFSGFAVSMPYKNEVIKFIDYYDDIVKKTGACNTVVIKNNKLYGYNTDYLAIQKYLEDIIKDINTLYILGNGCYSRCVQQVCIDNNVKFHLIVRDAWEEINILKHSIIFNCTPVENISVDPSNIFIDCINTTETGHKLAILQAELQFKLYTDAEYD